jgi:outer membrane protein TolC
MAVDFNSSTSPTLFSGIIFFRGDMGKSLLYLVFCILGVIAPCTLSFALTLEEAISLAKETLPSYKAVQERVKSSEALFNASLSPYLPTVDATSAHGRIFTSSEEFRVQSYDLTLRYTLFDWGNRRANRNIARLNLDVSEEDLRKNILDLEFDVKSAFYTVQALREALEQRGIQLKDAEKDYEIADGRFRFGIAKLSDVLQASVRLEQARFNRIQTEGNLKKGLSELNSLLGRPLESDYDLESLPEIDVPVPDIEKLSAHALKRPEIKQAEDAIQISENSKSAIRSTFLPTFSADASYVNSGGDIIGSFFREEKTATLRATWNIFELGKFYTYRSAELEKNVSVENLNDIRRRVRLDVRKTFEDFVTSWNKLKVARTQLKQAEHNYSQAFGEYKVGKADILALIQAESLLADSREQVVLSKLSLMLSKALLERVAGIGKLETLTP